MSKLVLAADKLREIWDDYKDTNIYNHTFYPYGHTHELPEWMKYVGWPPLRKMLRFSCAQEKRPFIYYESYPANELKDVGVRRVLYLPRNKKNFSLASNLLLVAQRRNSKWGSYKNPVEVHTMTARYVFYFIGPESDDLWNAWLDTFLNDNEWRFNAGLPKRVITGE